MLPMSSLKQLRHDNLHTTTSTAAISSSSKPPRTLFPLSNSRTFPCFNSHTFLKTKSQNFSLKSQLQSSKANQITNEPFNFNTQKPICTKRARVYLGFKLTCHYSRTGVSPQNRGKNKKGYGGRLPSVLKSLESSDDVEKVLSFYFGDLNPKEQTIILREQSSWEKVVMIFEWMKSQKDYEPNVIHYNVLLRALGRAQQWDELRHYWVEMAKKGVMPTNNTYSMLVDVYGKEGLVKEAVLWIKHMKLRGMYPDEVTMSTVVRVLKDGGEFDRGDKFYKDWTLGRIELDELQVDSMADFESGSMSEPISLKQFLLTELFKTGGRNIGSKIVAPEVMGCSVRKLRLTATYNNLIDLYGKAGRLKEAAEMFAEMLKSGVAADTVTFNTMIFTCGSHGYFSEAETLLNVMEEQGIPADTKTYNIFLSLFADMGNLDAAYQCYKKIREVGLFPDAVTYRAVLPILCKKKMVKEVEAVIEDIEKSGSCIDSNSLRFIFEMYVNEGLVDRAESIFQKCQLDGGLSSKTYTAIINSYAEKGLWAEAESVFVCKRDLGEHKKDTVEYNVMIKAYGKAKLYEKAFMLFKSMKDSGIWPDEVTYNSLIQMLSGGDLVDRARELLTEMQGAGFRPHCLTFSAIIGSYVHSGRLSEAVDIYQEMARVEVKPNVVVFGSLINGFVEADRLEDALQYFNIMEEFGISADDVVLTSLIKAYRKAGIVEGAKRIYEKMKDLKGGPGLVASNCMLDIYADLRMVSEAKLIFDKFREKSLADGTTYAAMMCVYVNKGMLDEALEIKEEMKHSGLLWDCISYNKVMACFVANGHLIECGKLLHEMESRKLLLDGGTFKVLFTVLERRDVPGEALRQLELSYQEGKPYAKRAIITTVYSVLGLHPSQ